MTTEHLTPNQRRFLINAAPAGSLERHAEENAEIAELIDRGLITAHADQNPHLQLLLPTDLGRLAVSEILKDLSQGLNNLPQDSGLQATEVEAPDPTTNAPSPPLPEFNFQTYFDPTHASAMRSAVDEVMAAVNSRDDEIRSDLREKVASIVVNLATAGERDLDKLVGGCLAQLPQGGHSSVDATRTEDSDLL